MKYAGLYLNLDRSPTRRVSIEQELARVGLAERYKRFPAVEGNALGFPNPHLRDSEIGCFSSHYRVLAENAGRTEPLHIIEDDIVLSQPMESMLDRIIESGSYAEYDIIFTDVYVPLEPSYCKLYKSYYDEHIQRDANGQIQNASFCMIDMAGVGEFASACSYLVNPASIPKLVAYYEEELKNGARVPVDIYLRELCHSGVIRIGCLFPFLTSIPIESCFSSTIGGRFNERMLFAMNLLRHTFYVGCNMDRCHQEARQILPLPEPDDSHRQIMAQILGHLVSGK